MSLSCSTTTTTASHYRPDPFGALVREEEADVSQGRCQGKTKN